MDPEQPVATYRELAVRPTATSTLGSERSKYLLTVASGF
jgi:hypothetical protein